MSFLNKADRLKRKVARSIYVAALRTGELVRKQHCERCGHEGKGHPASLTAVTGHHADYSKPLEVEWLCGMCHRKADGDVRNRIRAERLRMAVEMGAEASL